MVPIKFDNVFFTLQNLEQPHITNLTDKRSSVISVEGKDGNLQYMIHISCLNDGEV